MILLKQARNLEITVSKIMLYGWPACSVKIDHCAYIHEHSTTREKLIENNLECQYTGVYNGATFGQFVL